MNKLNFDNTEIAFGGKSQIELKKAYWLFKLMNNQKLVNLGTKITERAIALKLPVQWLLKYTIYEQFCGGESLEKTTKTINKLGEQGSYTMLDYGVEAKTKESDFDETVKNLIDAILYAEKEKFVPVVSSKITGLGRFDLLEKVSSNEKLNEEEKEEWKRIEHRLIELGKVAYKTNVAIFFDAEESWVQPALDSLITDLMDQFNRGKNPVIYNTIQLYRHDRLEFLKKSFDIAEDKGYTLAVKLVRGAYMEKERIRAKKYNYESPIHKTKEDSDHDFNAALEYCLERFPHIAFCNASHNEASALYLAEGIIRHGLPKDHKGLFFAQLYGMSDHLSFNLAKNGFNVAKYLPYGPIKEVIPYLIRRARENTSVSGQMSRELSLLKKEKSRRK